MSTPPIDREPIESYEVTGKRTKELTRRQIKKARITGIVMFVLAAIVMFFLAPAAAGTSTFGLSFADETIQLPPLSVPSQGSLWVLAMVLGFLGATQFFRGFQSRTTVILGIAFAVFVFSIMVWATAGQEFSLISMLVSTIARATPIALGALSGILCERSGVVNIGIEGMLLGGAFTGVVMGSLLGGWVGLLAATLTGGVLALLLAVLAVNFRVDQIIVGVVINILVLGLTSFLTAQVLVKNPDLNNAPIFQAVKIPILGDIPIIGPMFFDQTIIVYGMFILIASVTFLLFRTRWGLRTRSVGENPKAADSLGIKVAKVRYLAVIYGGMVGGFAGAWFTLGTVGRLDEGMPGGRG
ncbi:MAG: ABC transporter permease, partial [Actinobacteria bacterium]|nr:ABC transporter permease [Actinomycetota bacterium]